MQGRSDDNSDDTDEYRDWDHDLTALQDIGEEILDAWRNDNPHSPRNYPSARWLADNGYSNLRWILDEKHDMGLLDFFTLFTSSGGHDEYNWLIDDVATITLAKRYLDDRVKCRDWEQSTKRTNRSRINGVLRRFSEEYGDAAVVAYANDPARQTELYDTFKQVGLGLREDCTSGDSAFKFLRAAHRFFEWLERSNRIEFDPMEDIEEEFRWPREAEPTPLDGEQVERLWITAETDEERVLVIGYCVWGLRTSELPAVHVNQLHLDQQDPVVKFDERDRKNGQGEVSLLFGLDTLATLLDKRARRSEWNGYLFPSPKAERDFLCAKQAREKFKALCRRANVTIDGDVATPKHGRSFYYNILADAETDLLEMAAEIAQEQGAKDPASVRDYYLTPDRRDRYRRVFFRLRMQRVLPDDAFADSSDGIGFDRSLDDFE